MMYPYEVVTHGTVVLVDSFHFLSFILLLFIQKNLLSTLYSPIYTSVLSSVVLGLGRSCS